MKIFTNTSQIRLFSLYMSLFIFSLVGILFFREYLGIPPIIFRTLFSALLILHFGLIWLIQPTYIQLKVEGKMLEIRYSLLLREIMFMPKRQLIQIHQNDFKDFEIIQNNYGLSALLILKTKQYLEVVNYAPISVTLSKQTLLKTLLKDFKQ